MSFLNAAQSFLGIGNSRKIKDIDGYIVLTENARDDLEITQQPVETGAPITDHAFLKPTIFSTQIQFKEGFFGKGLNELYQDLLDLQGSREPFTVDTPKRVYDDMLIQSLSQTTDPKTENVLAINVTFQEVILVQVTFGLVPRIKQKFPGNTGGIAKAGKKVSAAKQGFNAITGR